LANRFPAYVVCIWLGNSLAVAREHYLQVTDEHFEQAAGGVNCGALVAHFPTQPMQASDCQTTTKTAEVVVGSGD
jgi:hypothetical protein